MTDTSADHTKDMTEACEEDTTEDLPEEPAEPPAEDSGTGTTEAISLPFITIRTGKTETDRGLIESFNEGEDTPCWIGGYT